MDKSDRKPQDERTFIMVKPDGVQRNLVSKVLERFENKGYQLVAMKMVRPSEQHFQKHYSDLKDLPFFPKLMKYMLSGPVVATVWKGTNVVAQGRKMLGATKPQESNPGTLRGDYCIDVGRNLVHGSDSVENAEKEIGLWFKSEELCDYERCTESWVYEQLN